MSIVPTSDSSSIEQKKELLKNTYAKGLTDAEFELFSHVCKHTGLDPFIKQIYAVKRKDSLTIQVGIDGLRSIAERTGNYSPGKEPSFQYDDKRELVSATAYVKKRTPDGTWHDVSATAFLKEYKPAYGGTFWTDKPHIMIAKCAEALAIRRAFPAITANLYTNDEMDQAEPVIDNDTFMQKTRSVDHNASKHKQIDSTPNERPSESFTTSCLLRPHLEKEGIPADRLDEWISIRAKATNQTGEALIDKCLDEKMLPKFIKSFAMWLNPSEQVSLAV